MSARPLVCHGFARPAVYIYILSFFLCPSVYLEVLIAWTDRHILQTGSDGGHAPLLLFLVVGGVAAPLSVGGGGG